MKKYFFIPGHKLHKIEDIKNQVVDEIIIDLEDSINQFLLNDYLEDLKRGNYEGFYIRISVLDNYNDLKPDVLTSLIESGFTRFVLPKLPNVENSEKLLTTLKSFDLDLVLLIETPMLIIDLPELLKTHASCLNAIGIGSHDLLGSIGAEHTLSNMEFPRQHILYSARAYDIEAIDFASMNISDKTEFRSELMDGFGKGFDAKFFVHPWQLEQFDKMAFYSKNDLIWALNVEEMIQESGADPNGFGAQRIDKEIIEKPHIKRAHKILTYFNKK